MKGIPDKIIIHSQVFAIHRKSNRLAIVVHAIQPNQLLGVGEQQEKNIN